MKRSETEVLVVGGGASGSMMALELARHGVGARTVDRLPGPSTRSRAITVHARTLELLQAIDIRLLRRFTGHGIHCPGYVIHYVDGDDNRSEVRPGLDYRQLDCAYPYLLLHRQDQTEAHLRSYLKERFGRDIDWGVSCHAVAQDGETVVAELEHADGTREQVRARYLVAADGANSPIRRALGLADEEADDYGGAVLQNLDVELQDFPDDPDWVHYCAGPDHFVMVARLPGGFYRLLMSQPPEHADAEATPHDVFRRILDRHFDGVRFGQTWWHSRWQSVERLAHTYRRGNVFLAGDAAHVHSTAGGQGMNCCLQDSLNLGWKLAAVLHGRARPGLLDTYGPERQPIGAQVIDAASRIHRLFMAGRDSDPAAFRELRESGFVNELVGRVSGIAYHYRDNALAGAEGLQPGDRVPDAPLGEGGRVYDLLGHAGLTLLVAGDAGALTPQLRSRVEALVRPYAAAVRVHLATPAPGPYEPSGAALYLIRPDGYLAAAAPAGQPEPVAQWLRTRLLPSEGAG